MLLIDTVRYDLWIPPNEDIFEKIVAEHIEEIYGKDSKYFDLKHRLASKSGTGSIPDGYVISLGNDPAVQIIEMELAYHSLQHIVAQIVNIINGIGNSATQQKICNVIEDGINQDDIFKIKMSKAIKQLSIHRFLSDSFSKNLPTINIIIDKSSSALEEAINTITPPARIIEFQTFAREGVGLFAHAHLFVPVYIVKPNVAVTSISSKALSTTANVGSNEGAIISQKGQTALPGRITIPLQPAFVKFPLIPIRAEHRKLFPGVGVSFIIETDKGNFETHVTGAKITSRGDPKAGSYLRTGIPEWSRHQPGLRGGSKVQIEIIEPMHRYKLTTTT